MASDLGVWKAKDCALVLREPEADEPQVAVTSQYTPVYQESAASA